MSTIMDHLTSHSCGIQVLSLPYFIILARKGVPSLGVYVSFLLSVTLSAPLLILNLLFKSPLLIPTGLFDRQEPSRPNPSPPLSIACSELHMPYKWSYEPKHSTGAATTVVENRRSTDVWITKGDAVQGKGKIGRALSMLFPKPKLSVIPPEELSRPISPPVLIADEESPPSPLISQNRSRSGSSAQLDQQSSKDGYRPCHASDNEERVAQSATIMVAQKQYSTRAQTVVVPPSPEKAIASATGVGSGKHTTSRHHLRSRSISTSLSGIQTPTRGSLSDISHPPPIPLPPTPPSLRAAKLAQVPHKRAYSSSYGLKSGGVKEIDTLSAGVLPLLVPGLKIGEDVRIRGDGCSPPSAWDKHKGKVARMVEESNDGFSSPEAHLPPPRDAQARPKMLSHRRKHSSLPR